MPEYTISGIPVKFPFEPYDVQKKYMEKVIECLQTATHGILESPTGTGKTLSLLCSSLAWTLFNNNQNAMENKLDKKPIIKDLGLLDKVSSSWNAPKVIYASRTHSQLSQAMQELKRTEYNFMKAVVLGSRDQLCIHPEVSKEQSNAQKTQMCKLRVSTHSCSYYKRVDTIKNNPDICQESIVDIEDLVKIGQKLKLCPYFGSKELIQKANIIFMPYNYLLDPKARRSNNVEIENAIIILDEAHNIEKICEESVSVEIKSSDIALAIDDVTYMLKEFSESENEDDKEVSIEDLAKLKEILLALETIVDELVIENNLTGATFPGYFMFDLLEKANINFQNYLILSRLIDSIIEYLALPSQGNSMFRRGGGLQVLADLLIILFDGYEDNREKVKKSFKVHIEAEESKAQKISTKKDGWITPKGGTIVNSKAKKINYWCFNPGFGMSQLLKKNVRSIILTSGTLAPLKPLLAELNIPVSVRLENGHIVGKSQVCVKVVSYGPDKEQLNSCYKNRDNPKYINSLGRTILSFCPVIPDGVLVFFPSYPLMNKCLESWKSNGIWTQINRIKPILVEPKGKDAFNTTMIEFYNNINDPNTKGACFMAVCRGKVSEGLDFADMNGRAVIITGLPFPPLKDPKIILKKEYLGENRTIENELLTGDEWYSLEATRAVNQAIGRVIRHKDDYGAILLCDCRFNHPSQKSKLSSWIKEYLQDNNNCTSFGPLIGEVSRFFRYAEKNFPVSNAKYPLNKISSDFTQNICKEQKSIKIEDLHSYSYKKEKQIDVVKANEVVSWTPSEYSSNLSTTNKLPEDFMSRLDNHISTINFNEPQASNKMASDYLSKDEQNPTSSSYGLQSSTKKRKRKIIPNTPFTSPAMEASLSQNKMMPKLDYFNELKVEQIVPIDRVQLLKLIKNSISNELYTIFINALMAYKKQDNFEELINALFTVFKHPNLHYLLKAMRRFVKENHKELFDDYVSLNLRN